MYDVDHLRISSLRYSVTGFYCSLLGQNMNYHPQTCDKPFEFANSLTHV